VSSLLKPNTLDISPLTATGMQLLENGGKITIVKQDPTAVVLRRRAELLRNIDYMETQIGRLAKMARDVRAEVLLLTTE
jgi:hypothetical protein